MDFASFKMPSNATLIIVLWGIVSFVVWYFYRHASRKYRVGFRSIFSLISALFFFILVLNGLQNSQQPDPTRIAIFPFTNQADSPVSISWQSLAFSGVPTRYLEQRAPKALLPYQLDWITAAADLDSLVFRKYCLDFAKRIYLDYAVLGDFVPEASGYSLNYYIYSVKTATPVFEGNARIDLDEIRAFGRELSTSIVNRIFELQNEISLRECWNSTEQLQHYFEFKHFSKDNLKAALASLQNSVKNDSSSIACLNSLAEQHLKSGLEKTRMARNALEDFRTARSLLLQSLSLDEHNSETLRLIAELYLANERWSQAEEYLRKSLELNPWDPETYLDLAQLHPSRYVDLGFKNERELLENAIFLNPCDFKARLLLADNYRVKNRYDLATRTIKEILKINPNKVKPLMALASFSLVQNDLLKSLETYKKILELEPDNADVYYNLGIIHYNQKDYDQAIEYFEHAIKLVDHVDSHLYLAYIYEKKNDIERALKYLRARIAKRTGSEDRFADEARKHLAKILSEDQTKHTSINER